MDYKQYCEVKYEFRRKTYIEQQVDNRSKTTLVSYLLWFLGGFGTSFYHGKIGSAIGLLILTLLTVWFTFGILTAVWVIIDAF